ncbi:UNVERIFIED_CONTAM: hypothetical protein Sradi_5571600 [Sesamum radiatum]|uniref:DUF4283 domain-containing protein n=1 Tax=Sesamum radiatum TaxID=300843 RepID=A0AAW2L1C9_SESRA
MTSFILNPADFPSLAESTRPGLCTTQSQSRPFSEAASRNWNTPQRSECDKFYLADSIPSPIGSVSNINGRPTITLSDIETQSLAVEFRFALVGKFSHGSPPYNQLHRLLANTGIKEAFTVSMLNNKHALISLTNELDYSRLWLRRIWFLKGSPMRVFKWSPTFNPNHESSIVPIWVNFPGLPAHLFRKDALFAIASMVGTPLQVADSTYNRSKMSRASVCIEIDLLRPCLEEVDIQIHDRTFKQKIEYEQTPRFCLLCNHVGHQDSECYSKGGAPKPPLRRAAGENENAQQRAAVTQQFCKVADEFHAADRNRYSAESNSLCSADDNSRNAYVIDETETTRAENIGPIAENDTEVAVVNVETAIVEHIVVESVESVEMNQNVVEHANVVVNVVDGVGNVEHALVEYAIVENNDENGVLTIEDNHNDAENDASIVGVNEGAILEANENVEGVDEKEPSTNDNCASGALIVRSDNFLCDLKKRATWLKVDNTLRLFDTFQQFGKVIKGFEEDVKVVIKRNALALRSAMIYQKCVLIFDRVSQLYLKPCDERSPPIATRTRRRKKGKNSLEPPDFHYF